PSTCTAVLPANSISRRDLLGRCLASVKGSCTCFSASPLWAPAAISRRIFWVAAPGPRATRTLRETESPAPASILPLSDSVWTARHACSPPRAETCFLTICAALRRAAVGFRWAASDGYEKPRHKRTLSSRDFLPAAARTARFGRPGEEKIDMAYAPSLNCPKTFIHRKNTGLAGLAANRRRGPAPGTAR